MGTAIQCIYRDMEYAKSLIKRKAGKNAGNEADDEDEEESWTFVGGDEPDPDMTTKRLSDGLGLGGRESAFSLRTKTAGPPTHKG